MHRMIRLFSYFLILCIQHFSEGIPLIGINTRRANKNEFPFIVSLSLRAEYRSPEKLHFCGGALITAKHVLTTAHCIENLIHFDKVDVKVSNRDLESFETYQIKGWITYKKWIKDETTNESIDDIAVVELTNCVRSNGTVALTNLSEAELDGQTAWIVGWVNTKSNEGPRISMVGGVEVSAAERCLRNHKDDMVDELTNPSHRFLCTIAIPSLYTECSDSGSPLILKNGRQYQIIGVTKGACYNEIDDVTTQIHNLHMSIIYYKEFIVANTRCEGQKCCIQ